MGKYAFTQEIVICDLCKLPGRLVKYRPSLKHYKWYWKVVHFTGKFGVNKTSKSCYHGTRIARFEYPGDIGHGVRIIKQKGYRPRRVTG